MAKKQMELSAKETVEFLRNKQGVSQKKLAEAIGLKTQQGFQNIITAKKGMRSDNFVRLINALGYEVIVRKALTEEEIVITAEDTGNAVDEKPSAQTTKTTPASESEREKQIREYIEKQMKIALAMFEKDGEKYENEKSEKE